MEPVNVLLVYYKIQIAVETSISKFEGCLYYVLRKDIGASVQIHVSKQIHACTQSQSIGVQSQP